MITVLGSINIDLTFPLTRLPSPGETALTPTALSGLGGKGANQAVAAARDLSAVRFLGCVGSDAFGAHARQALAKTGVETSGLHAVPAATGLASIWVDSSGRNMIAVASGANGWVKAVMLDAHEAAHGGILVLQMEIPPAEVESAIRLGKTRGLRVLLNLAPALPISTAALEQVDILVLNEHEAASLAQQMPACPDLEPAPPDALLRAIATKTRASVIITLGSQGAMAACDGRLLRVSAPAITPVDTTGAGDCFVGVLASGLSRGMPLPDALRRAVAGGSLACLGLGAQTSYPDAATIDAALTAADAPRLGEERL